jgi:DNA-binding transcriptional MerR regulator/effector-binding domain-containing protein
MFKIGEFSRLGQVSTRMLRHYDKLGLLAPSETDPWTGYRYYTIDQLAQLHRLIALKEMGLSLPQIAALFQHEAALPLEELRGMLRLKEAELAQELEEGRLRLLRIRARLQQIEQEGEVSPYEIVVKEVAPLPVATVRTDVPHVEEMGHYCALLTNQVYTGLKVAGVRPLQPELILYHTTEYRETDLDVEAAVAVLPRYVAEPPGGKLTYRELPGHDLVASLIYEGPLVDLVPAVLALIGWVGRHGHVPAGPLRELHLSGPAHLDPAAADQDAVTELQVPIRRVAAAGAS